MTFISWPLFRVIWAPMLSFAPEHSSDSKNMGVLLILMVIRANESTEKIRHINGAMSPAPNKDIATPSCLPTRASSTHQGVDFIFLDRLQCSLRERVPIPHSHVALGTAQPLPVQLFRDGSSLRVRPRHNRRPSTDALVSALALRCPKMVTIIQENIRQRHIRRRGEITMPLVLVQRVWIITRRRTSSSLATKFQEIHAPSIGACDKASTRYKLRVVHWTVDMEITGLMRAGEHMLLVSACDYPWAETRTG